MRPMDLSKDVRNSVSGQTDCCKALKAHPPSEKEKQVSLNVVSPDPVRAATQTQYSICWEE